MGKKYFTAVQVVDDKYPAFFSCPVSLKSAKLLKKFQNSYKHWLYSTNEVCFIVMKVEFKNI